MSGNEVNNEKKMIKVQCPECGFEMIFPFTKGYRIANCSECGNKFVVDAESGEYEIFSEVQENEPVDSEFSNGDPEDSEISAMDFVELKEVVPEGLEDTPSKEKKSRWPLAVILLLLILGISGFTVYYYQDELLSILFKDRVETHVAADGSYHEIYIKSDGEPRREVHYTKDGEAVSESKYEYDDSGRKTNWLIYDAENKLTERWEYRYDNSGKTTGIILYGPEDILNRETTYLYEGELRTGYTVHDKEGNLEMYAEYSYDTENRICYSNHFDAAENLLYRIEERYDENNHEISEIWYEAEGFIVYRKDYNYRDNGKISTEILSDGYGNITKWKEYHYEADGNCTGSTEHTPETNPKNVPEAQAVYPPGVGKDGVVRIAIAAFGAEDGLFEYLDILYPEVMINGKKYPVEQVFIETNGMDAAAIVDRIINDACSAVFTYTKQEKLTKQLEIYRIPVLNYDDYYYTGNDTFEIDIWDSKRAEVFRAFLRDHLAADSIYAVGYVWDSYVEGFSVIEADMISEGITEEEKEEAKQILELDEADALIFDSADKERRMYDVSELGVDVPVLDTEGALRDWILETGMQNYYTFADRKFDTYLPEDKDCLGQKFLDWCENNDKNISNWKDYVSGYGSFVGYCAYQAHDAYLAVLKSLEKGQEDLITVLEEETFTGLTGTFSFGCPYEGSERKRCAIYESYPIYYSGTDEIIWYPAP